MNTPPAGEMQRICVAALYRFAALEDLPAIQAALLHLCTKHGVRGTLLLATEGINGTIAGSRAGVSYVLAAIRALPDCADLDVKYSSAATMPFHRMKVRLKREIVTMGQAGIDPRLSSGTYVEPEDWNALISDPDTIVIDTRNDYEVAIGSFQGAINPQTAHFRDFPAWFAGERERLFADGKSPKVAMFCTGGIRCEKATAYLKQQGIADVAHLKGGILKYLETVPAAESFWQGECFIFDQRVAVGHGLTEGSYALCFACRRPLSATDRQSPLYEEGVSCGTCHGDRSEDQRRSYRERHRQETNALRTGRAHVGAVQKGAT